MIRPTGLDQVKLLFSFVLLLLAAAHMRWPSTLDQLGILIVLFALLPWIIPYLRENFTSIEILGTKIALIERKVEDQTKRIDHLFALSMGDNVFAHLRMLANPPYGPCFIGTALPREFGYLESLGFIRYKAGMKGLDDFLERFSGKEAPNLSDYIEITDTGRAFFELRAAVIQGPGKAT
jgi:hypothetical protein